MQYTQYFNFILILSSPKILNDVLLNSYVWYVFFKQLWIIMLLILLKEFEMNDQFLFSYNQSTDLILIW